MLYMEYTGSESIYLWRATRVFCFTGECREEDVLDLFIFYVTGLSTSDRDDSIVLSCAILIFH